jgi:hypothetical protein
MIEQRSARGRGGSPEASAQRDRATFMMTTSPSAACAPRLPALPANPTNARADILTGESSSPWPFISRPPLHPLAPKPAVPLSAASGDAARRRIHDFASALSNLGRSTPTRHIAAVRVRRCSAPPLTDSAARRSIARGRNGRSARRRRCALRAARTRRRTRATNGRSCRRDRGSPPKTSARARGSA